MVKTDNTRTILCSVGAAILLVMILTHKKKLRKSHKKNLVPDKMLDVSEIASRLSKQCTNVVNESILNLIDLTV